MLSVWSLRSGKLTAATNIISRLPEQVSGGMPLADSMSAVATGAANPAMIGLGRIILDDGASPVISLDDVTARVLQKSDGMVLEIARTRRQVPLGLKHPAVADACARLPRPLGHLDEATWTALVPAEAYREICPSDATTVTSR
jgi:hypothetical protein